jgi:hypothetical protein
MSTNIRCPERAPRGRSDGPIIGCAGSSPLNRLFAMGRKRFDGLGWLAVLVFAAIVSLGAQESRRAPKFEGKIVPDPPRQGQPWTAPKTKLPKSLVEATGIIFDQGVADPRGCEYRQVSIGGRLIETTHGFVLPERADVPGRFVVCWDGQVHPALDIGIPADLDRDVNGLVTHLKRAGGAGRSRWFGFGLNWGYPRGGKRDNDRGGLDDPSSIKLCLLLRLGRADLAEALFAAGTNWTPERQPRDRTDDHSNYVTLANDWAESAYTRLILAHELGDDAIALDTARRLVKFRDLVSAKAEKMGLAMPDQRNRAGSRSAPLLSFLNPLDLLLRDHERRAKMPPRGPIPKKGADPSARVAALIRDLDQIDEQARMSPEHASPGDSPLVQDLVDIGAPAVAPLLEVLESDNRLTRSVSHDLNGFHASTSPECFVHPVHEAAFEALRSILRTGRSFNTWPTRAWLSVDPPGRKEIAGEMRQFWEKNRSVAVVDRWYRTLLDDSAGPNGWLAAAEGLIQPVDATGGRVPEPGSGPMQGEALGPERHRSVTALLVRRAAQMERPGDAQSSDSPGLRDACQMGLALASWDERAALPILKDLMKECRSQTDRWRKQELRADSYRSQVALYLAQFAEIRIKLGDSAAFDEYADWLRNCTPIMVAYVKFDVFKPLLAYPDQPALASAARWMFNDPESAWIPLFSEERREQILQHENLFASPLMVVAGFREAALGGLADKSPLGTVECTGGQVLTLKIKGEERNGGARFSPKEVARGVKYPFRRCDLVAKNLSSLEGCPQIELFWEEGRRDEAVAACVAYVKKFGASLTADLGGRPEVRLKLPILGKPATPGDVESGRAIFSLEGQGETRLASMPGFPQPASWVTLKDSPVGGKSADGVEHLWYDTDGYVWQAEEVKKGDAWERYYGFVGHHVIGRAPAAEIEFRGAWHWWALTGGLDATTAMVDSRPTGYEPRRQVLVKVLIRNRLGVAHSSPTEFIRPGPGGKPALRKGLKLALWYTGRGGSRAHLAGLVEPSDQVEPRGDAHFDPGHDSRLLAPLESFEAMQLDLSDWFDLSKPGIYFVAVTFAGDSGMGEGTSVQSEFTIRGDE